MIKPYGHCVTIRFNQTDTFPCRKNTYFAEIFIMLLNTRKKRNVLSAISFFANKLAIAFITDKKDMKKGDSLLIKHLLFWRSGRDSNSRYPEVHCISSAARYDHFDTTP